MFLSGTILAFLLVQQHRITKEGTKMLVLKNRPLTRISTLFSLFSGFARKQADYKKLNHHILALNQKQSPLEIIDEVSVCLKSILNYRLFAFAIKNKDGVDVWLDPRMYQKSLEHFILTDFKLNTPEKLTYINQTFFADEPEQKYQLTHLLSYELKEKNCLAKIYMLPSRTLHGYHDELIQLILQSAGVALSRQMDIDALKESAVIDPLTGCYNRRELENHLKRHIAGAIRHNGSLSVFMFDLDHFKKINDTYGHLAGDQVLKSVVNAVQNGMRTNDILTRYGGEEFMAILPETSKTKAIDLANRLRNIISKLKIKSGDHLIKVTASFGVAELDRCADMNKIMHDADTMLYKAKLNGRNTVMPGVMKLFTTMEPASHQEKQIL